MPPLTREDVVKWLEKPGKGFNDQDLTGCDLGGMEITGRDFKRAQLTGARLTGAKFDACEFKQAVLTSAELTGAAFSSCLFHAARLDGATIKDVTFEYCEFKGATWTDAVVKRCTFDSCEEITGLPPHKIYATLSDMPDDAQKREICRERFAPLQQLIGGAFEGAEEDTVCDLVGEFRGRPFLVRVDLWDGSPMLRLEVQNTSGAWFILYRDPKRRTKAAAAGTPGQNGSSPLHFFSESVYLEEDPGEELDLYLQILSRLHPDARQSLFEAMETFKLANVEVADEYIEAEYKKDILVLDLTKSVPLLLDLFSRLAEVVSVLPAEAPELPVEAPVLPAESPSWPAESPSSPVQSPSWPAESPSSPVQSPSWPAESPSTPVQSPSWPAESPSFDLTKHCRHCGTVIPWGEFECPSCGKSF